MHLPRSIVWLPVRANVDRILRPDLTYKKKMEITADLWLCGLNRYATWSLSRDTQTNDYGFYSLSLDGKMYDLVENNGGFRQWAYMVSPEAFSSALVGTKYETGTKWRFLLRQEACRDGQDRVRIDMTVRYLVGSCCGDGIKMTLRRFRLILQQRAVLS